MDRSGTPDLAPDECRPLTGLRGLAALLVMLHHFYLRLALDQHLPLLQWLLRHGYLGVDLFFVLSGFVMSLAYGTWFDGSRPVTVPVYLTFIARRLARLWPLHAIIVSAMVILNLGAPGPVISARMLLANLMMVQAWGFSAEINAPAWSVSTEFLAYLAFPLLAACCLRARAGAVLAAAAVLVLLSLCLLGAPPLGPGRRGLLDLYNNYSLLPVLRCFAGFVCGMLAFRVRRWPVVRGIAGSRWFAPVIMATVVAMLLGRVHDLVVFASFPLLVLGLYLGHGPLHGALSRSWLYRLGVLSYATYLVHYVILSWFSFGWAPLPIVLPVYFAATIGLAAALHHLIEQPGRRLLRVLAESAVAVAFPRGGSRHP